MKRLTLITALILFLLAPLFSKPLRCADCTDCAYTCVHEGEHMYWDCRDAGLTAEECQGIYVAAFCGCHNANCASCGPYPACP